MESERHSEMIPEHHRSVSDAGSSIVQEVFGFIKRNLSRVKRRKNAA
jgi:hypothetical protein